MSSYIYGRQRLSAEEIARLRELERRRRAIARENRFLQSAERTLNDYLAYIKRNGAHEAALIARSEGEDVPAFQAELENALATLADVNRASLEDMTALRPTVTALLSRVRRCHVVLNEDKQRLRAILDEHIAKGMNQPWVAQDEVKKQKKKAAREATLAMIEERLAALAALSHLPQSTRDEIGAAQRTARALPSLGDFVQVTLIPLEKRCHEAARREADRRLRYALASEGYLSLCAQLDRTPSTLPALTEDDTATDAIEAMCEALSDELAHYTDVRAEYEQLCEQFSLTPENYPMTAQGIADMEDACNDLYERIERYERKEYMRRVTEEVLSSFGYRFYGSTGVARKDGRVSHMLFEGEDGSAVSMTTSADGRITMSFGGIDTTAREATREERARLYEGNRTFCSHRPDLVRAFAHYGVILDEEGAFDPDSEEIVIFGKDEVGENTTKSTRPVRERAEDEADRRTARGRKFVYDTLD